MEPKYIYRKQGSGKQITFLVLEAQTESVLYRFISLEPAKDKSSNSPGCKSYLGWGCLAGLIGLVVGDLEFDLDGDNTDVAPRKWELRRADESSVFQLQKIRRGFDILRDGSSIGRIEWQKRKKIVDHELILGDRIVATAVPTGLFRNEVNIELESGRLATLKNTTAMTSNHYGEVYIKRELDEDELGLVLGVGLLWL